MKHFKDSKTGKIYGFEDDVKISISSNGVFAFKTKAGVVVSTPSTLKPYTPPPPAPATLAQKAAAAMSIGLRIQSASIPAIDATYPTTGPLWVALKDESTFITSFGGFSSDEPTWDFPLNANRTITFTEPAQVKAIVKAICIRLHILKKIGATNSGVMPADFISIP